MRSTKASKTLKDKSKALGSEDLEQKNTFGLRV